MNKIFSAVLFIFFIMTSSFAGTAIEVLGKDFVFPEKISGMPEKLSEFSDLKINSFKTSDGVSIKYWEAGEGEPLVFIPGWSSNGAEYISLLYLLKKNYHVYVVDLRNQGLSDKVNYGIRISRHAQDIHEFFEHLNLDQINLCGWSMGASLVWSYVDLHTAKRIKNLVFVDQAPSIYSHSDWSEEERLKAGSFTTSVEQMVEAFSTGKPSHKQIVDSNVFNQFMKMDSPYFRNAIKLSHEFIKNDPAFLKLVMFDHATNDWRDVIKEKINIPTTIFSGTESSWLPSQKWINSSIKGSKIYIYNKDEYGDHFLHLKNPRKFVRDLAKSLKAK